MSECIAIIGIGLIGSSLARALTQQGGVHIAAYDISQEVLAYAKKEGFVSSVYTAPEEAVKDADIIILASTPSTFSSIIQTISPFLKDGAIITDVGSVKSAAIAAIAPHLPRQATYVPGHPIAGSERSGITAGSADLFTGKKVILTPEESDLLSEPVTRISTLWKSIGGSVEYMPPQLHDIIYAYVSHLPQLVAFAVGPLTQRMDASQDENTLRFMRLTKSDPGLWADICLANTIAISSALEDFTTFVSQIEGELSENRAEIQDTTQHVTDLFPYIVATCLIATASTLQESAGVHPVRYAGSGFADMTAPAARNPEETLAAISAHHKTIAIMLGMMLKNLRDIKAALMSGNTSEIIKTIKNI